MAIETKVMGKVRRELNRATFSKMFILSEAMSSSSTDRDGWMMIRMEARICFLFSYVMRFTAMVVISGESCHN